MNQEYVCHLQVESKTKQNKIESHACNTKILRVEERRGLYCNTDQGNIKKKKKKLSK